MPPSPPPSPPPPPPSSPPPLESYDGTRDYLRCLALDSAATSIGDYQCKSIPDWRDAVGTIPTELGKLTGLEELTLVNKRTSGSMPTEVGKLTRLHDLVIGCAGGSCGTIDIGRLLPTEIGYLTALNDVYVSNVDAASSSIPTEIGMCTDLELLDVEDASIGGTIPSQLMLGSLTYLRFDVVSSLAGTIPTTIGNILTDPNPSAPLEEAFVELNNLPAVTGTLPTEIGRMSGVVELQISRLYNMGGSIPTEVGMLASVSDLELYNNDLGGVLPTELAWIATKASVQTSDGSVKPGSGGGPVDILKVHGNGIGGVIPTEFGRVIGLSECELDLANNPFWVELGVAQRDNSFEPNPIAKYSKASSCQLTVDYATPPSPPPAATGEPAEGVDVEGEIILGGDCAQCSSSEFKDGVCAGVSRGLNVAKNRCSVTDCICGSIVIKFLIRQVSGEYTDSIAVSDKLKSADVKALIANYVAENTGVAVAANSVTLIRFTEFSVPTSFEPPPPPSPPPSSPPPAAAPTGIASTLTDGELAGAIIGSVFGGCCLIGLAYGLFVYFTKPPSGFEPATRA